RLDGGAEGVRGHGPDPTPSSLADRSIGSAPRTRHLSSRSGQQEAAASSRDVKGNGAGRRPRKARGLHRRHGGDGSATGSGTGHSSRRTHVGQPDSSFRARAAPVHAVGGHRAVRRPVRVLGQGSREGAEGRHQRRRLTPTAPPSTKVSHSCTGRRSVTIRLDRRYRVRAATVMVNGKVIRVRYGRHVTATISLRGRAAGTYTVRTAVLTKGGRVRT